MRAAVRHSFVHLGAPLLWSENRDMVCYKFDIKQGAAVPVLDIWNSIKRVCATYALNPSEVVGFTIEEGAPVTITVIVRNKQATVMPASDRRDDSGASVETAAEVSTSRIKRGIDQVAEAARAAARSVSRKLARFGPGRSGAAHQQGCADVADLNYYRELGLDPEAVELVVRITRSVREAIEANAEDDVYLGQSVIRGPHATKKKDIYIDTGGLPVVTVADFESIKNHVEKQSVAPATLAYQYTSDGGGAIRVVVTFES
jgi:hypothetical protein